MTSQVNVENVKNDFNEYPDDDFGVIGTGDDDEIAGRRRYISVAAINAAKVRKRGGQNSSPISPPNWNWNEPSSQSGKSFFLFCTGSVSVVYFGQLLSAARNQKLVKILYWLFTDF